MTKKETTIRFIYGSKEINKIVEYDNDEIVVNENTGDDGFCDNNCYSCEMVCPYKEY